MVKTFIFVSLILHIITLYVVYYLYKQTDSLRQLNLQDVKELLENTVATIKEENQRLQNNLQASQIKANTLHQTLDSKNPPQTTTENKHNHQKENTESKAAIYMKELESTVAHPIQGQVTIEDTYEPTIQGQVLQLHKKGLSTEQIAQALRCGKTEVDLILRFNENK